MKLFMKQQLKPASSLVWLPVYTFVKRLLVYFSNITNTLTDVHMYADGSFQHALPAALLHV
jgi:hypothetical protein